MKVFVPARHGCEISVVIGSYLPETVVDNQAVVDGGAPLEPEQIEKLTGIRERRRAHPDQATSDLAVMAARSAMSAANVSEEQVERLILATTSPDFPVPSAACLVQHKLGLRRVPAFDVSAACSGFVYALDLASRAVATGDDTVLAVAAEIRSRFVDPTDRSTAALFGDGAAAAVVRAGTEGADLVAVGLSADGSGARSVFIPAGGSVRPASAQSVAERQHYLRMADGPQVYFSAVEGMLEVGNSLLGALDLDWDAIDWVVPHQPNARLIRRMARVGGIPDQKVVVTVDTHGNTSGAAVGLALHQALLDGRIQKGHRVVLLTAGAGYTGGAALLRF